MKAKNLDLNLPGAEVHESNGFGLESEASPDFLAAPKKGEGVRRLNHVPLLVIGVLIILAVLGITYTLFARQAANIVKLHTETHPPVHNMATPPVKPSGDILETSDMSAANNKPAIKVDNSLSNASTQNGIAANSLPSEAYKNRIQQIQQIENKRLAQLDEALNTDGSVQSFHKLKNKTGTSTSGAQLPQLDTAHANVQDIMQQYLAANGSQGNGETGGIVGNSKSSMSIANGQDQKRSFLANMPDANTYLAYQRKAAISAEHEVKAGTVIPGIMISGINSDLPGQIIGQVRQGVYDSASGNHLLIPSGARLIGTYDSGITLGQKRALVAWQRIIYPDGSSISLGSMPGTDQGGYAGFNDKVDNHYLRIFGNGILLSVFSAGIQLSQPQASNGENYSSSQIIAGALGQQMGQLGIQISQRNMDIQPTLEIRPGYEFNVMVTKDIILPSWSGHPMASRQNK